MYKSACLHNQPATTQTAEVKDRASAEPGVCRICVQARLQEAWCVHVRVHVQNVDFSQPVPEQVRGDLGNVQRLRL